MGNVYRARDLKLERTVALKFLPPELTRDGEARERFFRKAIAATSLEHTNICTFSAIKKTGNDQYFIYVSYIRGETLKRQILKWYIPIGGQLF